MASKTKIQDATALAHADGEESSSMSTKSKSKRGASTTKSQSAAKRPKTTSENDTMVHDDEHSESSHRDDPSKLDSPLSDNTLPDDGAQNHSGPGAHTPPPALANTHPDFEGVNYIPYDKLVRASKFALKVDPDNNRYGISRVPGSANWGTTSTTNRVYCYNDRPITYWLLGIIESKWFTNFKGDPQLRVNVGLRLPYQNDDALAKKIYKLARPPKKDEDIPDLVYASKYMAKQVRGSVDAVAVPFRDVYDAQYRFRAKREMCIIHPACISKNDLILVEAFLTRWNTAKDKKGKAEWISWDVNFELQAISLLFEAPAAADENEYGPADNIRDDM